MPIAAVDSREFIRFFITGVLATICNLAMVWLTRHFVAYKWALFFGLMAGFTVSFVFGKLFAFRSASWRRAHGELARFLIVYLFGASLYWGISMVVGQRLLPMWMPRSLAELAGAFVGASVMVVTSYLGHRFFTYRGANSAP